MLSRFRSELQAGRSILSIPKFWKCVVVLEFRPDCEDIGLPLVAESLSSYVAALRLTMMTKPQFSSVGDATPHHPTVCGAHKCSMLLADKLTAVAFKGRLYGKGLQY